MKTRLAAALTLVAAVALSAPPPSRGKPEEAKAMLAKAIAHYKAVGRAKALADFTKGKPPFRDRDLYVACIGLDGRISANGAFPMYVGGSPDLLKDSEGKPVGRAILDLAKKGEGVVHYRWINPVTHKTEPKTLFGQKVGDDVCGVGVYTP